VGKQSWEEDTQPIRITRPHNKLFSSDKNFRVDENEKYDSGSRTKPEWWVGDEVKMVLALLIDESHGINLRNFRRACNIYVNGHFLYCANIRDMMSAQACWKALKDKKGVRIEPTGNFEIIKN
jgi:hypothetical protein